MSLPSYTFGYKGALGLLPLNQGPNIPFSYFVTVPNTNPFIDLQVVKDYLKIDGTDDDAYITLLIQAVGNFFQDYTGRTLLTTTYETFRDFFNCYFLLKKSPFQSVESIEYLKDNTLTLVDSSIYYATKESIYSSILLAQNKSWPSDADCRLQAIKITFKAGYGDTSADIPQEIIIGMLQHIADLYENRGDCNDCRCVEKLPSATKLVYDLYKIRDMGTTTQIG